MANHTQRRAPVGCYPCRALGKKCDGQSPQCGLCQSVDAECVHQSTEPSQLETDITTIRQRLEHIENLLENRRETGISSTQTASTSSSHHESPESRSTLSTASGTNATDEPEFPTMVIRCSDTMELLNLNPDLGYRLIDLERAAPARSRSSGQGLAKGFMLHPQRVASATTAFSENIHCWFPFLPAGFSQTATVALGGNAQGEAQRCAGMLVLAIGSLAETGLGHGTVDERPDVLFLDEALPLLPTVISDYSLPSLYSLILFSLYYLCLMRPCHAHDYILMASHKIQDMLKSRGSRDDFDHTDAVQRAYWAVLLIESELKVQLDVVGSGIEKYLEEFPLPASDSAWYHYSVELAPLPPPGPAPIYVDGPYIAARVRFEERRPLWKEAGSRGIGGGLLYSLVAAKDLKLRLHEWCEDLPSSLSPKTPYRHGEAASTTPRALFLKTLYAAAQTAIHWSAACVAIDRGLLDSNDTAEGCGLFLSEYISFVDAATTMSYRACLPHAWTLTTRYGAQNDHHSWKHVLTYSSIFTITMCALRAEKATPQRSIVLEGAFLKALGALQAVSAHSPSLAVLHDILTQAMQSRGIEQ